MNSYTKSIHITFVLFALVFLVSPIVSQSEIKKHPKKTVERFLKNIKQEDFDKSKKQLIKRERKEAEFNGAKLEVGGERIGFSNLVDGNAKFNVRYFEKSENEYSTVRVIMKQTGRSFSLPFQVTKKTIGKYQWKIQQKRSKKRGWTQKRI